MQQPKTAGRPKTWGGALVGRRSSQQDTFLIERSADGSELLALVADGMGGHAAGALASQTAAAAFGRAFRRFRSGPGAVEAALRAALDDASQAILEAQDGHPDRQGMGTTLVAALVSSEGVRWISVGDSALLLCRDQQIRRLNEDHSLRAVAGFDGGGQGNLLRSAINGAEIALVDCQADPLALDAADVLILASDGILTLSHDDMLRLVQAQPGHEPEAVGAALIRAVARKDDPKQDNCTVVAISGFGTPAAAARAAAPKSGGGMRLLMPLVVVVALVCAAAVALLW